LAVHQAGSAAGAVLAGGGVLDPASVGNYTFSCLLSEKSYIVKQPCQIRLNINNFWSRELGVIGYQKNFICIGHA